MRALSADVFLLLLVLVVALGCKSVKGTVLFPVDRLVSIEPEPRLSAAEADTARFELDTEFGRELVLPFKEIFARPDFSKLAISFRKDWTLLL